MKRTRYAVQMQLRTDAGQWQLLGNWCSSSRCDAAGGDRGGGALYGATTERTRRYIEYKLWCKHP